LAFSGWTVHPRITSIADIQVHYVWNRGPLFKPLGRAHLGSSRRGVPGECNAAPENAQPENGRRVRRAGVRRRIGGPLPARSPAKARLQREGIRGRSEIGGVW
jgi:hypothetical protein